MTEDHGNQPRVGKICDFCFTDLGPFNIVGEVVICKTCYDKEVFEMAISMGVHEKLADRLTMMAAQKKWKKFLNE